jgi:hypothetical protein
VAKPLQLVDHVVLEIVGKRAQPVLQDRGVPDGEVVDLNHHRRRRQGRGHRWRGQVTVVLDTVATVAGTAMAPNRAVRRVSADEGL